MPSTLGILASSYKVPTPTYPTITASADTNDTTYDGSGYSYVTIPSDASVGDLCYIAASCQDLITITTPSGWTRIANGSNHLCIYRKVLTTGEPGSSVPLTLSTAWYPVTVSVVAIAGFKTGAYENVIGTVAEPGWVSTVTPTGPTTTVNNCLCLAFAGLGDWTNTSWGVSGGSWTELHDSSNSYSSCASATLELATAGAIANPTFTPTTTANLRGVVIAVEPA